jgi:hypothetical protein
MNIFFLDENPTLSAQYHVDKHVVKMILETAQLLCSCSSYDRPSDTKLPQVTKVPYKLSHKNHPCAIWARESLSNYLYLCEMGLELGKEYTYRYGKKHKSIEVIEWCIVNKPNIPDIGFTTPAKAMPDEYKVDSVVESYRNYYMGAKISLASWKNREKPFWFGKKELDLQYD